MRVWDNLNLSKLSDPEYAASRQHWLVDFLKDHQQPLNPDNPPKIAKTTWSWLHAVEEIALWRWLQGDSIKIKDLLDTRVTVFYEYNLPDKKAELSRMSPWPVQYPYHYAEVEMQRITRYRENFHNHWLPAIVARTPTDQHRALLLELLTASHVQLTEFNPDNFVSTFLDLLRSPDQEVAVALLNLASYTYLRVDTLAKWSPPLGAEVAATLVFFDDEIGMHLRENGYFPVIDKYKGSAPPVDVSALSIEI